MSLGVGCTGGAVVERLNDLRDQNDLPEPECFWESLRSKICVRSISS